MINKPATARKYFVLDDANANLNHQLIVAKSAVEVSSVKAISGGGALAGHVYDASDPAQISTTRAIPFSCESSGNDNFTPGQPIPFSKGCIIIIEEGLGTNGEVFVAINGD